MTRIHSFIGRFVFIGFLALGLFMADGASAKPPLKALLISGGGYHDYAKLVPFLTSNLTEAINIKFDVSYDLSPLKTDKFADDNEISFYLVIDNEADPV
jgi:hypothetical protein